MPAPRVPASVKAKAVTQNGWFAVSPSGMEDVPKLYAEIFRSEEHLAQIQEEARAIVETLCKPVGV